MSISSIKDLHFNYDFNEARQLHETNLPDEYIEKCGELTPRRVSGDAVAVAIHIDHIENTATVIDQTETIDDSDKESLSQTSIVKDEGHSDMETCSSAQDVRNSMLFGPCSPYHFLAPSFSTRYPLSVNLKAIR